MASVVIQPGPLVIDVLGVAGTHPAGSPYGKTIIALLDRVWPPVKGGKIANTGINHVIYDDCDHLFAGVVTVDPGVMVAGLERRTLRLGRHATWLHVGPYAGIHGAWNALHADLKRQGLTSRWPQLEIYGHWNADESKLETTLVVAVD